MNQINVSRRVGKNAILVTSVCSSLLTYRQRVASSHKAPRSHRSQELISTRRLAPCLVKKVLLKLGSAAGTCASPGRKL